MFLYFKEYLVAFFVFLGLDMIWLTLISKKLYQENLGYIMAEKVNFLAAVLFYLLFVGGMVFFVIHPAIQKDAPLYALAAGAFLGLLCYATYDLTNLASIKNWPLLITVIDLIWGTFVTGATCWLAALIVRKIS